MGEVGVVARRTRSPYHTLHLARALARLEKKRDRLWDAPEGVQDDAYWSQWENLQHAIGNLAVLIGRIPYDGKDQIRERDTEIARLNTKD